MHYDNMFHGVLNLMHGPLEFKQSHKLLADITNVIKKVVRN